MKKQMTQSPALAALILKQRENFPNVFLIMIRNLVHPAPILAVPAAAAAVHPVISEMRLS